MPEQERTTRAEDPSGALLRIIEGFWLSRALAVAVALGIPDLLQGEARSAEALADATATHAPSLRRLLRALAGAGVLIEDDAGRYAATPLADALQTDAAGSLRAFFLEELDKEHQRAWGELLHSVRTGETAFGHVFGTDLWRYRARHPKDARSFDAAMADFTAALSGSILERYDFPASGTVVDVGGGDASLLAAILGARPRLRGVLLDLPRVLPEARRRLEAAGLAQRCEIVAGDFFSAVPPAGDLYILKAVLHDWDDVRAAVILENCRRAIAAGGRLLLIEAPLAPPNVPSFHNFMDLNMLVMTGGRERTEAEYRRLLSAAGFATTRVIPVRFELCLIEAAPAAEGIGG